MDLPLKGPLTPPDMAKTTVAEGRLISLDALRGFDMFWIIGGYVCSAIPCKPLRQDTSFPPSSC